MIVNVVAGVWPLVTLTIIKFNIEYGSLMVVPFMVILFVFMFPHPTYLFYEAKHLLQKDGIAEPMDLTGIVVFGGLSLLGLILQVVTNVFLIDYLDLGTSITIVTLLSFVASFGACLGLTDLVWLQGFWAPKLIRHTIQVLKSKSLMLVCIGTTILLTILTAIFI